MGAGRIYGNIKQQSQIRMMLYNYQWWISGNKKQKRGMKWHVFINTGVTQQRIMWTPSIKTKCYKVKYTITEKWFT